MKKIAILVASVLVLGGFSTRTFAAGVTTQTTQTTEPTEAAVSYKDEAGITPDSLLYVIDKAVDDLRVVLAGSEEKEAAVTAEIAEERLGESEVMTEAGKVELAQKALAEYNEKITEAAAKLQEVIVNLGATSEESSEEATEENTDSKLEQSIADLEKVIQEVQEKSLVVLDSLKDVVAEDSVEAIEDVIEAQTAHKEAVANFVAERHEFNAAKKALNMAKVALKKVEKGGSEEAVKAAQDKLTAAQTEYVTAQTELRAAFQAKKAADLGIKEDKEEIDSEEVVQAPAEEAVTAEENNQAVEEAVTTAKTAAAPDTAVKPAEYTKTNNGNGNKSIKIEKEEKEEKEEKAKEKSAPGKSTEEHGKSNQGNGKKK